MYECMYVSLSYQSLIDLIIFEKENNLSNVESVCFVFDSCCARLLL